MKGQRHPVGHRDPADAEHEEPDDRRGLTASAEFGRDHEQQQGGTDQPHIPSVASLP